jgi:hypothetical protein
MKVHIEMPLERYDAFLDKCVSSFADYAIMKRAVLVRRPNNGRFLRVMEIRCDSEQAESLLDLAIQRYPAAISDIRKAIIFQSSS